MTNKNAARWVNSGDNRRRAGRGLWALQRMLPGNTHTGDRILRFMADKDTGLDALEGEDPSDVQDAVTDTLANMFHAMRRAKIEFDPEEITRRALMHFEMEADGD